MYRIKELSQITGISDHAIRYYERVGVLPNAARSTNGYRMYTDADIDRLQFLHGARQLELPLNKIAEILALRDEGVPPCQHVRQIIADKITEVHDRIQALEKLQADLVALDALGKNLPVNSQCVCQRIGNPTKSQQLTGDENEPPTSS